MGKTQTVQSLFTSRQDFVLIADGPISADSIRPLRTPGPRSTQKLCVMLSSKLPPRNEWIFCHERKYTSVGTLKVQAE
jgi:hypothetical protein